MTQGSSTPPKKRIALPVIVEGKYDKIALTSLFEGNIYVTNGFSIFNAKEKQALFRRIAGERGVILLTDPDGGGKQIRSFLLGILPRERVHSLNVPKIAGKERRKSAPSRAGTIGVEGMDRAVLERVFAPFLLDPDDGDASDIPKKSNKMITKVDFFEDHLTGCPDAKRNRQRLARHLSLPDDMTANALLEAANLLLGYEAYKAALVALAENAAKEAEPLSEIASRENGIL